ncbi:site-specific integrase [Desulforamulus ruminis]|uniref:tyrosine-type recombinase/integrase n=2 Tax=Desulforamulus ruminis TaxID=1564 RepID=UPI002FD8BD90
MRAWLPTHRAGKSTIGNYKAAYKYFAPVHDQKMDDIYVDDLQECIDDCPKGKRTKENMKALCGLVYKYAVPRQYVAKDLILSQYLVINEKAAESRRTGLTMEELERLRQIIGTVPYADYAYCMCYLGFRPSEFLDLQFEHYNRAERYFTGGAKTEAGKDRIVPVSPKIQKYVDALIKDKIGGYVFCDQNGGRFNLRRFREDYFAPIIEAIGISREEREARLLTPHCCRHTFANLMKNASGADKDKLALIGHTTDEMLRHYQDADLAGLRKIVDAL